MMGWYPPLNDLSDLTWHMFTHVVETKSTWPSRYLCSWWIISYSCLHPIFINFNACTWLLSLSSWSLPSLLLAFTCTKREYCLCIQSLKPQKLFHMSPLYLPICGIYLPFQVNLYVPNSKPSNEILFCMLE